MTKNEAAENVRFANSMLDKAEDELFKAEQALAAAKRLVLAKRGTVECWRGLVNEATAELVTVSK